MNFSVINIFIVGAFLLTSLVVGLWFGRKVTTMRDYALANKSYGTGPLVMTYVATVVCGYWIFADSTRIFEDGIGIYYVVLGMIFAMFIRGKFIAPRMLQFRNCFTLGDIMGQLFGVESKVLAGVLSVIVCAFAVGYQILILGFCAEKFLGMNQSIAIIISGIVVIVYCAMGGMRAVVATDMIQFIMLIGVLLLVSSLLIKEVGGIEVLFEKIPSEKFQFVGTKNFYLYSSLILLDVVFSFDMINTPLLERMLMAKSPYHIRKMLYISGGIMFVVITLVTIIGFSAFVLYPTIDSNEIIPHIFNNLLPKEFKGIAIVGLISVLMSSADSQIHNAGVMSSRDIVTPIAKFFKKEINEIIIAKLGTCIVGVFAILFALYFKDFMNLEFICSIGPIMIAPLLLSIFGIKSDKRSFWTASISFFLIFVWCKFILKPEVESISLIIAVFTSLIVYMITHISVNGGILIIKDHGYNSPDAKVWKPDMDRFISMFVNIILFPIHFAKNCKKKIDKYGTPPYVLFGGLYLVVLVMPYFLWQDAPAVYDGAVLNLRLVGIFLCALMMTESIWPDFAIKYLPAFWYVTLTYCLTFLPTVLLLVTNGAMEYVINVAIIIMFLIILVDWVSAVFMSFIGIGVAAIFYKYYICAQFGIHIMNFTVSHVYMIAYQLIFGAIVGILFSNTKQFFLEKIRKTNLMVRVTSKQKDRQLRAALSVEDNITKGLGMKDVNMVKRVEDLENFHSSMLQYMPKDQELLDRYAEGEKTLKYLETLSKNALEYLKLDVQTVSMDLFLSSVNEMANIYTSSYSIVVRTEIKEFECDAIELTNVMTTALHDIHSLNVDDDHVTIDIVDTEIVFKDSSIPNGQNRVEALQFTVSTAQRLDSDIFKPSYKENFVDPKTILPLKDDTTDSVIAERVIAAHCGIAMSLRDDNGYTEIFIIPKYLRQIRPSYLDADMV